MHLTADQLLAALAVLWIACALAYGAVLAYEARRNVEDSLADARPPVDEWNRYPSLPPVPTHADSLETTP